MLYFTISLNLVGGLSDSWANTTLAAFKTFTQEIAKAILDRTPDKRAKSSTSSALSEVPHLSLCNEVASNIPKTIRTAKVALNISPEYTTYAVCPVKDCSRTYRPIRELTPGLFEYPTHCQGNAFRAREFRHCGAELNESVRRGQKSVNVPKKVFQLQSLDAFVANMLVRPGMQELLCAGMRAFEDAGTASDCGTAGDIFQSPYIKSIRGSDGKPFMTTESGELRLAWVMSIDWFNPFYNKAAGKRASVGSVVLTCANLPAHLCNNPENQQIGRAHV